MFNYKQINALFTNLYLSYPDEQSNNNTKNQNNENLIENVLGFQKYCDKLSYAQIYSNPLFLFLPVITIFFSADRHLLYNGKNNMQAWGLIVLLVSKTAGHSPDIPDMEQDKSAGVLHSQRALAEVTEMIRISHLVHQGLVNLQPLTQAGHDLSLHSDMTFGNKIALLSGDYLLGNSCAELAGLR